MIKKGEKMPIFESADGKRYFNFALGLKVAMHGNDRDKNEDYIYEIVGCRYMGNTEYYDIKIDGIPNAAPDSANRVKYLLSRYGVRTLAVGQRQELPLTVAEVKYYYEFQEYYREEAQRKAKGIPEYAELKSRANELITEIGYAEAYGNDSKAAYLSAQRIQLELQANKVLKANGINPENLVDPKPCRWCGGRGYISNIVCGCALKREKEIKEFCAANRLRLKELMHGGARMGDE